MVKKAIVITGVLIGTVIVLRSRKTAANDAKTAYVGTDRVFRTLQGR